MAEFLRWVMIGLAFGIGFSVSEAVIRFVAGLLGQSRARPGASSGG